MNHVILNATKWSERISSFIPNQPRLQDETLTPSAQGDISKKYQYLVDSVIVTLGSILTGITENRINRFSSAKIPL